jgi:hypothetical protein
LQVVQRLRGHGLRDRPQQRLVLRQCSGPQRRCHAMPSPKDCDGRYHGGLYAIALSQDARGGVGPARSVRERVPPVQLD